MHLISSAGLLQGLQNERYINKDFLTKFILTFVFVVCEHKYFIIVSVTINLCQRKIAHPNAPLLDGKTSFSSFRIITAKFSSVPKFRNFTVSFFFSGLCNKRT